MPFLNEHAARINDPSKYKSFHRANGQGGLGVDFIFGVLPEGGTEIQTIRFDSKRFSPDKARKWLKEHDYKDIVLEPAIEKKNLLHKAFKREDRVSFFVEVLKKEEKGYSVGFALDSAKPRSSDNIVPCGSIDYSGHIKIGSIVKVSALQISPKKINERWGIDTKGLLLNRVDSRKFAENTKEILHKAQDKRILKATEEEMKLLKRLKLLREDSLPIKNSSVVKNFESKIVKAEGKKQVVTGVVYAPDIVDSQGDSASAEEIEKAAYSFMEKYQQINLMHETGPIPDVKVVESFIAPCDYTTSELPVRKGSWVMSVHIMNPELWALVESGKLDAFSIEGSGIRE